MSKFLRIKKTFAVTLVAFCMAGGLFVSCHRPKPSWDANILAPVINASLSINNLLADTLLKTNPDSSVTLVYDGSLYDMNTDSLLQMPDTTLFYPYGYPQFINPTTVGPGQYLISPNINTTTYDISTAEIRKAIIQSGFVDVEVTSHINQPTDITYIVPSATLNGNPLTIYVKVPADNGSSTGYAKKTYSLANYNIDFTGPTHNSYNTISTNVHAIVDSNAAAATVKSGDSLVIKATFYSITPSYARGYFGTVTKTYTAQVPFPLFSKVIAGKLDIQDMSVNMMLQNYFGIDARVDLTQLSSVNTHTATTVNLADAGLINENININRGTETYNASSPVIPSLQTFSITPANSNILQWTDNLPDYVNYTVQITTDPLGNVSGSNDFAYSEYGITSNLNISVPLSVIASNLTLEDTLSVDFTNTSNAQQVKSGTFTLYATNGFPFSAGLQVYLLDNNMKLIDSLMAGPQTISPGTVNVNGIVITPQNSTLVSVLSTTRTQSLLKTKHIIIYSRFNMGPPYLKIYSYYQLNVKLVGNFDYQFNG